MNRFRLSEQARSDLDDLWLYIAMDNTSAADRTIDEFIAKFELLASCSGSSSSSLPIVAERAFLCSGRRTHPKTRVG